MRVARRFAALLALMLLPHGSRAEDDGTAFFEARIRPILVEKCQSCHGAEKARSSLRLDSRSAALKGGDLGPAVVPGDPDASLLLAAVRYDDEPKMPPKAKLPAQAIADLETWVRRGAPWPDSATAKPATDGSNHWAFRPVERPAPPQVQHTDWARDPIDRFILAKLEAKSLTPSAPADRRTLIRRATFDLTGLPPMPEEVDGFLHDPSPIAYERLVDRLLASPRYGERWGRHWLDVARYSDTKGYVFFEEPGFPWAYTYRDYVIRSWNEDRPYDRFLVEQIAADRLDLGHDRRPLAALGFLTLGGRFMNIKHDILDDRIDVVTRGLLGLTVTCARCHDHKFDPVSQQDYYALYGVFESSVEPTVPPLFEPEPTSEAYWAYKIELEAREGRLAEFVRAKHDELVAGARRRAAEYLLAAQAASEQPDTGEFMLIADGSDLNPTMIVRWQAFLEQSRKRHDPIFAPWHELAKLPPERFSQSATALGARLAGPADLEKPINRLLVETLSSDPPRSLAELAQRYSALLNRAYWAGREWRMRATLNGDPDRPLPDPAFEEMSRVLADPGAPPNVPMNPAGDLALLPDRPSQARLQELLKSVEQWRASGPGAPPRAMALVDRAEPIEPRVFRRGNPNNPGETVPRRFLSILAGPDAPPFRNGSGRLDLAQAIASPSNPLTARVLVNRVWMHHFGSPLVPTPGDFGLRSEPPTHPELLDWLAATFVEDGWSLKRLHRRIVLSATYQQASADRPEARSIDPENSLLWRANRRRLDFEALRDAHLAVSGQLEGRLGGPSFADVTAPAASRRTLYASIDRLNLPGIFRTFDFPDPNATSARRDLTTVPPQALFLMNHPFMAQAGQGLVARLDRRAAGPQPIQEAYRLALGREATPDETSLARNYLGPEPDERAWQRFAQALLMTNEFATID
jgi:hypothetical protein